MREKNLLLVSTAVAMKLAKLGLDSTICHKCGRVLLTTEKEMTLCNDCQGKTIHHRPLRQNP